MNIFKREQTLFLRNKLFLIIFPLSILVTSIFFNKNMLDIKQIYSLYPIIFTFLIPLISSSIWLREKSLGLDGNFVFSNFPISYVIRQKFLSHYLIYFVILILELPTVIILSFLGFVDFGQVFSINLSIIIYIVFCLSITFFYSVLIKGRVLTTILSILTLGFVLFQSDMLYYYFKGIIIIGDLLFYLGCSFLFINLGISIITSKKKYLILISSSLVIIISQFVSFNLDSTSLRSHSLSKYTKEIVKEMATDIDISFYYSNELMEKSSIIKDSILILEKFNRIENVNVSYISNSKEAFERDVKRYKPNREEDKDLYTFIVVKYNNSYQVIPSIPNTFTLQFEILKVLKYLKDKGLKKVGLYLGNEGLTEDNFNILKTKLSEHFSVNFLFPGDSIPNNLDTLIVLGHFGINYYYNEKIGDYLASGGNIIIAGTGLPTDENLEYRSSPILESLESMGITIEPYLIADKNNINGYELNIITRPNRNLKGNPVVDPFTGFIGVYLSPVLVKNRSFKNLLYTSDLSWLVDSSTGLNGSPVGSFAVAAYGQGSFSKYFTDHGSDQINRMLVLGNMVSLTDYLYTLGYENSYDFVIRSVYALNGDSRLIDVRNVYNWEKSYYKLESNLYKNSILNFVYLFLVVIYPIIIFLFCLYIKKKAEK